MLCEVFTETYRIFFSNLILYGQGYLSDHILHYLFVPVIIGAWLSYPYQKKKTGRDQLYCIWIL